MINEKKIDIIKSSKPIRVMDIVLFALIGILITLLIVFSYSDKGTRVEVTYQGKASYYPLDVDAQIDIDGLLTLVIEDGMAYVINAKCHDKVCEHSGKIKQVNRIIVCAPQNIIIKIVGDSGKWIN